MEYLVLPGYGGSGPQHWQSRWEASAPSFLRVEQADRSRPDGPHSTLEFQRDLAADWGAEFVSVGPRGHINAASGLGARPEGRAWLDSLRA